MSKPIIGISANHTTDSGKKMEHLTLSYIPDGYVRGVDRAGGVPLLLPVNSPEHAKVYVSMIDKLILTGGQNVDPAHYKEDITFDPSLMHQERDAFELALFEEARAQNKPVFGVCRGMQLINVALGGSLNQDISLRQPEPVKHLQDPIPVEVPTHSVTTEEGSVLRQVYGEQTEVNSFHRQSLKDIAPGLKVTAISPDNIVEGVESESEPIMAVQWHPDFAYDALEQEMRMFRYVVHEL